MIYKETVNAFIKALKECKYDNDTLEYYLSIGSKDWFLYPSIPNYVKGAVHKILIGLENGEILYVVNISSYNSSRNVEIAVTVTDTGIFIVSKKDGEDLFNMLLWGDIDHVKYQHSKKELIFFSNDSEENPISLSVFLFIKLKSLISVPHEKEIGYILSKIFTRVADAHKSEREELDKAADEALDTYDQLIEEGKEEEALQLALNFNKEHNTNLFNKRIAYQYAENGKGRKAIELLDEDLITALEEDDEVEKMFLYHAKSKIYSDMGEGIKAREMILSALKAKNTLSKEDQAEFASIDDDFKELEQDYLEYFLEIPYAERKLLVPVESYSDLSQKTLEVIDINNLPPIQFPIGHPIANQLYVGHPFIPSKYIPFENYELEFLEDKIREYCYVMQYLGATEISIESVYASSSNRNVDTNRKISGGAGYKRLSASAECEENRANKFLEEMSHRIQLHQTFRPQGMPQLPSNLIWYANEPSWQRTFEQRMQGGLLEHEERIETKKSQVIDDSQFEQISAELKVLLFNANVHWGKSIKKMFEAHENVILAIHVKFAPLESLQKNTSIPSAQDNQVENEKTPHVTEYTEAEKEYIEEVKTCKEESAEISPNERRLLNRLRDKLGITEERATELEASLEKIQLTEAEKDYLEEVKACMEESAEISSSERRLLNRLRDTLGITEERAIEIENSCNR